MRFSSIFCLYTTTLILLITYAASFNSSKLRYSKVNQHHKVLGVAYYASCETIKKARREKSRKYHPDKISEYHLVGSDEAIFAINNSFDQLHKFCDNQNKKGQREQSYHDKEAQYTRQRRGAKDEEDLAEVQNLLRILLLLVFLYLTLFACEYCLAKLVKLTTKHKVKNKTEPKEHRSVRKSRLCNKNTMGSVYTLEGRRSARIAR